MELKISGKDIVLFIIGNRGREQDQYIRFSRIRCI